MKKGLLLFLLLSCFWSQIGHSRSNDCVGKEEVEEWLSVYPTLQEWFHFYLGQLQCERNEKDFFKLLAGSESLSVRLAEQKVTFEQFYVPLYQMLVTDFDQSQQNDLQYIHSNLSAIENSLEKAMSRMTKENQERFRTVILLELDSEFA